MVIYLDVDGVLVDMVAKLDYILGVRVADCYDWEARYDRGNASIYAVYDNLRYYDNLEPFNHATKLIRMCQEFGEVNFVSSHGEAPLATASKMLWLRRHFSHIPITLTTNKNLLCYQDALLIDDKPTSGKKQYLWPASYNTSRRKTTSEAIGEIRSYLSGEDQSVLEDQE